MNEHRFEIGTPNLLLDTHGKRELLTIKDYHGKTEITFEMDADTSVNIVSGLMYLLTPQQLDLLAGKIVREVFDADKLTSFVSAIDAEQAEYERDINTERSAAYA